MIALLYIIATIGLVAYIVLKWLNKPKTKKRDNEMDSAE